MNRMTTVGYTTCLTSASYHRLLTVRQLKKPQWNAKRQHRQPQMGQLPVERITQSRSENEEKIGVDIFGPFTIKASPLRIRFDGTTKVWFVNFVCLVSKAVYLNLVSSLPTESFLVAFNGFCCRRGTSSEIWSDKGTHFENL